MKKQYKDHGVVTTVRISKEIKAAAKKNKINLSATLEFALRRELRQLEKDGISLTSPINFQEQKEGKHADRSKENRRNRKTS